MGSWARFLGVRLGRLRQYPPRVLRTPLSEIPKVPDNPPRISIVTPSLQQGRFLERTILSVLEQGYPNLEYFIQDGGSSDESVDVIGRYKKYLSGVFIGPDLGQADAINRGFAKSSGEIMAWLNADDVLMPGSLARVAAFFRSNSYTDAIYGHRIVIDDNDQEVGRWILPPHDDTVLKLVDFVPQESLFWTRRIWDCAGGHVDPRLQFAMDWELLLRFSRAGAVVSRVPVVLAAMRTHPGQKTIREIGGIGAAEMRSLTSRKGSLKEKILIGRFAARSIMEDAYFSLRRMVRSTERGSSSSVTNE